MQTLDREVLDKCTQWLAEGRQPWLCTIVGTVGSAPRPVGSLLACTADGLQVGSVSGGCVEEEMLAQLRAGLVEPGRPLLQEYGVTAEENERLGLPCGGRLSLLLQSLDARDADWLRPVVEALAERHCIRRELTMESNDTQVSAANGFQQLQWDGQRLQQWFGPRQRMLLVGAGQLARSLAELALAMDYEVMVTDPRKDWLDQWEGPEVPLISGMPDDAVRDHASDAHSLVITLTHDPRIDDMALMEALASDALYVGALGSMRTTEKRLERLRQLELSQAQLDRLHAPVGLDIGSKTPIEIAVAIMAELVALKRRRSGQ